MPIWCPKCNAMLPEGLEECPVCGARLGGAADKKLFTRSDILWFSLYLLGIATVPIIIALILGLICSLLWN